MIKFIAFRLLAMPFLLLAVSFAVFSLASLSPIDPAEASLRANDITITPEVLALTRAELGLNEPFLSRYASWLKRALRGDLGISYVNKKPVLDELFYGLKNSLALASLALAFVLIFGFGLGVYCGLNNGTKTEILARGFIFLSSAMPSFWLGLILLWGFSLKLGLFNISGFNSPKDLILPAITLSAVYISTYARLLRNTMLRLKGMPFMSYAKARGLSDLRLSLILIKNSIKPCIIALATSLPKLVVAGVVVENVFGIAGIGRAIIEAIFNRDYASISAYTLIMASIFIIFNLIADLIARWLDPSILAREMS